MVCLGTYSFDTHLFYILELYARERACTKVLASKACALTIVQQLYQMEFIGPAGSLVGGSKKNLVETKTFPVIVRDELERELRQTLLEYRLLPTLVVCFLEISLFSQFALL
jgi:hypothetical protein